MGPLTLTSRQETDKGTDWVRSQQTAVAAHMHVCSNTLADICLAQVSSTTQHGVAQYMDLTNEKKQHRKKKKKKKKKQQAGASYHLYAHTSLAFQSCRIVKC